MKDATLPENVELLRTRVVVEKDRVYSVSSGRFTSSMYPIANVSYIQHVNI